MVLITPRLVRPLDPDEVPPLPTRPGSFLKSDDGIGGEMQGGGGPVDAPPVKAPDKKKPAGNSSRAWRRTTWASSRKEIRSAARF